MNTSDTITKIAPALHKAQEAMLPLVKDSENPFYKSKYADLHAVTEACYPALQSNGIVVVQSNKRLEEALIVLTRLIHTSGEWIETECVIPAVKADAQAYGSAYTYGRRYGLQAAVGLAPEDDDGNVATKNAAPKKEAPKMTGNEKIAIKLSANPEDKWFEVPFPSGNKPHAGKTLGDVAAEQDTKALNAVLGFIDPCALEYPLAVERLKSAIKESKVDLEASLQGIQNENAGDRY